MPTSVTARMGMAIPLFPGADIQAALDANPAGTAFRLRPGTHRITSALDPKVGQQLVGSYGAVLSGSVILSSWTASGSDWYATRASGALGEQSDSGRCLVTGCDNPHDVFLNGTPLVRVMTQGALAAGKFWEDFTNNRVYVRDNPNSQLVEQASARRLIHSTNGGIRIRNLVLQHAASKAQEGAVEADGGDWLIEHNDIRFNHGVGVRMDGARSVCRRNEIHHNNQMGYGGGVSDGLLEANVVHHNNRDNHYAWGWEAGNKFAAGNLGTVVRGNYIHDENGPGIWFDINCGHILIEDNYVTGCLGPGIFYEISYGERTAGDGRTTIIRDNISGGNAAGSASQFFTGGQIVVSASRDVEVTGNVVDGRDGIGGLQQERTDSPDPRGAHEVHNLAVHDNDITTFDWAAGLNCDDATQIPAVFTSRNNTFEDNTHHVPDTTSNWWLWDGSGRTWTAWNGFGHDTPGGARDTTAPTFPSPPSLTVGPQP